MLNIVDVCIFLLIVFGAATGFRRGFIKQGIITIGTFIVLILSFLLKNPISAFMYKTLPFFDFDMIIKNGTVLNILVYEIIAFLISFAILEVLLIILIKLSSVAEIILRATVILEIPSKILGTILGILETYLIVFIILFILSQPTFSFSDSEIMKKSKLSPIILSNTLILTSLSSDTLNTFDEIGELLEKNDEYSSDKFNCEALEIMIENKFLTKKSASYLNKTGKINTNCGIK